MDQEKIGKFIVELRREKKLTQKELADKLGVTDRAVSNWETGRRLLDYFLLPDLCNALSISINEFFVGERINDENYKEVADENLFKALSESSFTLKERITFFKKKWIKDHLFELILEMIILIGIIIAGIILNNGLTIVGCVLGFICSIVQYNRMMAFIENCAYKKENN